MAREVDKITREAVKNALKTFHRRMIVFEGTEDIRQYFTSFLKTALSLASYKSILVVSHSFDESPGKEILRAVKSIAKGAKLKFDHINFKETEKAMGTTYDILVLDLTKKVMPNDLGRLVEVTRGGGVVVLITPPFDVWKDQITKYHEIIVTPPFTLDDVRHIFIPRMIKKLEEHDGIYIFDTHTGSIKKAPKEERKVEPFSRSLKIPSGIEFDERIYKMCATQDQIDALKKLEEFLLYEKGYFVLTANRGRGKSAVVGMAVAGYILSSKSKKKILVTSPDPRNVQIFFRFLIKCLEDAGIKPIVIKKDDNILTVKCKRGRVEYWEPLRLLKKKADLVVVDEAAGLQIPMLFELAERFDKIVFSSTIHGYEGAGRGFSIRFLGKLREMSRKIFECRMEEPIRYAPGDPIEKWLYDVLLLDAEPEKLDENDKKLIKEKKYRYVIVDDIEKFFEEEEKLRQFVGIYILAHYRNRPNDLMLLADAPHHFPRYVELESGKIINSLQIALEGNLPDEWIERIMGGESPNGNIIPDRIMKHYGIADFGRLKGIRIVRIATHPEIQGRGVGSYVLQELEKEAREKGFDWLGAGFGVNYKLLRFWLKNGYLPVHISPSRNVVSGEYSVLVVKPLSRKAETIIKRVYREFLEKFIRSLGEVHSDIEPPVAALLLRPPEGISLGKKEKISTVKIMQIKHFVEGMLTYESVAGTLHRVAEWYFLQNDRFLSEREEEFLIAKVLQRRSWEGAARVLGVDPEDVKATIRRIYSIILDKISE